jgi:methyltransferase (TIGR00027 family)
MALLLSRDGAKLPDFSYMLKVGQLRHIQSIRESGECRNPDVLVSRFLSLSQRWSCFWRGTLLLDRLRSDPFYYYVIARTKYYDSTFVDALAQGVQRVINVGCGSDTRAHRYRDALLSHKTAVLECDQAGAIKAKERIARRRLPMADIEYMPIDLSEPSWPQLQEWLASNAQKKTLVLMEGVSPYVNEDSYGAFLQMLAHELAPGSRVAYDYKIRGVSDVFGMSKRTQRPFRLSTDRQEVTAYHEARSLRVCALETSAELTSRLLPSRATQGKRGAFGDDCLLQLEVR